jgi:hypothetical protein
LLSVHYKRYFECCTSVIDGTQGYHAQNDEILCPIAKNRYTRLQKNRIKGNILNGKFPPKAITDNTKAGITTMPSTSRKGKWRNILLPDLFLHKSGSAAISMLLFDKIEVNE